MSTAHALATRETPIAEELQAELERLLGNVCPEERSILRSEIVGALRRMYGRLNAHAVIRPSRLLIDEAFAQRGVRLADEIARDVDDYSDIIDQSEHYVGRAI